MMKLYLTRAVPIPIVDASQVPKEFWILCLGELTNPNLSPKQRRTLFAERLAPYYQFTPFELSEINFFNSTTFTTPSIEDKLPPSRIGMKAYERVAYQRKLLNAPNHVINRINLTNEDRGFLINIYNKSSFNRQSMAEAFFLKCMKVPETS